MLQYPLCRKKLDWTCSTPIIDSSSINSNCNSLEIQVPLSDYNNSFHSNFQTLNNSDNHQVNTSISVLYFIPINLMLGMYFF